MRLGTLTMQGFGSYSEKAVVDFTVPADDLFLVTGDTGAGKSTIFNAVTYALFGEKATSGKKLGTAEALVSHYASPGKEAYVELSFTVGDGDEAREYTVRRTLPYLTGRTRKNGQPSTAGVKAELCGGTEESTITGPDEVTKAVTDLLSLNRKQFCQVAMIAQGEFVKLIHMTSTERKEIFSELFNTGIYGRITQELKARENKAEEARQKVISDIQALARMLGDAEEKYPGREELAAVLEAVLGKNPTKDVIGNFAGGAEELGRWLAAEAEAAGEAVRKAQKENKNAIQAESNGRNDAARFAALDDARERQSGLEERAGRAQQDLELAAQIEKAYQVRRAFQAVRGETMQREQLEKKIEAARQILPAAKKAWASAEKTLAEAEKRHETERSPLQTERDKAAAAQETFGKISQELRKEAEKKKQAEAMADAEENAGAAIAKGEKLLADVRAEQEKVHGEALALAQQAKTAEYADVLREDAVDLRQKYVEVRRRDEACAQAYKELEHAKRILYEREEHLSALQKAYTNDQAAILAAELVPGEPCPVCGSVEHPHPHRPRNAAGAPAMHEVEAAQRQRDEADKHRQEKTLAWREAGLGKKAAAEAAEEARKRLCARLADALADPQIPDGSRNPEELIAAAEEYAQQAADCRKRAGERAAEEKTLRGRMKTYEKRLKDLREQRENASREREEAGAQLRAVQERIRTLRESTTYPSAEAAREAGDVADRKLKELDDALRTAQAAEKEAARTVNEKTAEVAADEQNLSVRIETEKKLESAYRKELQEAGMSEPEWQELTAAHREEEVSQIRQSVQDVREEWAKAEGARKELEQALQGRSRPNLDELRARSEKTGQAWKQASERLSHLQMRQRAVDSAARQTQENLEKLREIDKEYDALKALTNRLSVTSGHVDLETHAQRYYLERAIDAANVHLLRMTGGEFELYLLSPGEAGGGGNKGLEIGVYSHITGKSRSAKTLSGGETFMAALSLALGMADQIEANASAVHMDMMFVDEGFGALDEGACGEAVRMLQDAAGRSRLIGIISHVPALKQVIEDQLVVRRTERGSRLHWEQL